MIDYRLLAFTLLLSACGRQEQPANIESVTSDMPAAVPISSAFDSNEVDARDLIDSLGAGWKGLTLMDPTADGYTNGYHRELSGRDRTAAIFTLPDGRVWDLQLRSGVGGRCGTAASLIPLVEPVLHALAPKVSLTVEQHQQIVRGLRTKDSSEIVEIGNVRVGGSGGCVRQLDIRKPQRPS